MAVVLSSNRWATLQSLESHDALAILVLEKVRGKVFRGQICRIGFLQKEDFIWFRLYDNFVGNRYSAEDSTSACRKSESTVFQSPERKSERDDTLISQRQRSTLYSIPNLHS